MDAGITVIIVSGIVSFIGGVATILITKWYEVRQNRQKANDDTKGALVLAKFGQEETIRKEMQLKIDRMERMLDRHERLYSKIREIVGDGWRDVMMTFQLTIHDINSERYTDAGERLKDGLGRVQAFKLPELPEIEEPRE